MHSPARRRSQRNTASAPPDAIHHLFIRGNGAPNSARLHFNQAGQRRSSTLPETQNKPDETLAQRAEELTSFASSSIRRPSLAMSERSPASQRLSTTIPAILRSSFTNGSSWRPPARSSIRKPGRSESRRSAWRTAATAFARNVETRSHRNGWRPAPAQPGALTASASSNPGLRDAASR